jgi:hypothetical protein
MPYSLGMHKTQKLNIVFSMDAMEQLPFAGVLGALGSVCLRCRFNSASTAEPVPAVTMSDTHSSACRI